MRQKALFILFSLALILLEENHASAAPAKSVSAFYAPDVVLLPLDLSVPIDLDFFSEALRNQPKGVYGDTRFSRVLRDHVICDDVSHMSTFPSPRFLFDTRSRPKWLTYHEPKEACRVKLGGLFSATPMFKVTMAGRGKNAYRAKRTKAILISIYFHF